MKKEELTNLINHLKYNRSIGADYLLTDNDADEIIKALEQQIKEKWIPVSERLPESQDDGDNDFSDWLLVTLKLEDDEIYTDEAFYCFSEHKWYSKRIVIGEVIAWMLLPEPYKAESEVRMTREEKIKHEIGTLDSLQRTKKKIDAEISRTVDRIMKLIESEVINEANRQTN